MKSGCVESRSLSTRTTTEFGLLPLLNLDTGARETVEADYVLDATELGDLLPLAGVEYVSGYESRSKTGELHALDGGPQPDTVQAMNWVMALGYDPDGQYVIDKPAQYEHWRDYEPELRPPWGGRLLSWERNKVYRDEYQHDRMVLFPSESLQEYPNDSMWHWRRIVYPGHYASGVVPHERSLVVWFQNEFSVFQSTQKSTVLVDSRFGCDRD